MDKWMTLQANRKATAEREWQAKVDAMVETILAADPSLPTGLVRREAARAVGRPC